jgi:hypothetical protein
MPLTIDYEPNDICVAHISGLWKRSEMNERQKELAQKIDAGAEPRLLAIADDKFEGWEKGADWNDLDFLFSHSDKIAKIAIVADPRWEAQALAFAGAGMRKAPVKFFRPSESAQARAWLTE